jgi:hypothetical protein
VGKAVGWQGIPCHCVCELVVPGATTTSGLGDASCENIASCPPSIFWGGDRGMHEAEQASEIALAVAAGERVSERVFVQSESGLFSCWPVTLISTASLAPPLNRLLGSIEVLVHRTTRPWERGNTRRAQLLLATVALGVVVMACLAPSASTLSPHSHFQSFPRCAYVPPITERCVPTLSLSVCGCFRALGSALTAAACCLVLKCSEPANFECRLRAKLLTG